MVANVFCTASTSSGLGAAMGSSKVAPISPGGFATSLFSSTNGLPMHSSGATLPNGTSTSVTTLSTTAWPPEGSQLTVTVSSEPQDDDRFEAKWAALETKPTSPPEPGHKTPTANATANATAANPFSNNLQKTFEIEL